MIVIVIEELGIWMLMKIGWKSYSRYDETI